MTVFKDFVNSALAVLESFSLEIQVLIVALEAPPGELSSKTNVGFVAFPTVMWLCHLRLEGVCRFRRLLPALRAVTLRRIFSCQIRTLGRLLLQPAPSSSGEWCLGRWQPRFAGTAGDQKAYDKPAFPCANSWPYFHQGPRGALPF